jgi:hypothetical protein
MVHAKRPMKAEARKRKLTELFVRKVRPRDKAYLVWDEHQHGLALRVQPTGTKSYVTVYSRRGRALAGSVNRAGRTSPAPDGRGSCFSEILRT